MIGRGRCVVARVSGEMGYLTGPVLRARFKKLIARSGEALTRTAVSVRLIVGQLRHHSYTTVTARTALVSSPGRQATEATQPRVEECRPARPSRRRPGLQGGAPSPSKLDGFG